MTAPKVQAAIAMAALSLGAWGCATKKYVRQTIAPVQQQLNQVEKNTEANKTAIGDLDRQVATIDENTSEAARKAQQAANAAARANIAAVEAADRANQANGLAEQAMTKVNEASQQLDNLDNYTLSKTTPVYFRFGQSVLSKEAKDELDATVGDAANMHNYVIEIEGYTDRTGSKAYNLELARRRADAVARYLTIDKGVPLRNVRMLGVGAEFRNAANRTREQRKENRRVDVKVYSLDLTGQRTEAQVR